MSRTVTVALFLLGQMPIAAGAATCTPLGPVVTSVAVRHVTPTRYLNFYHVSATVMNRGEGQSSSVLQFVDVNQYGDRLDDRGVPPLAAGQSYTISYVWKRAVDAGSGTTPLDFRLRSASTQPPQTQECPGAASITF